MPPSPANALTEYGVAMQLAQVSVLHGGIDLRSPERHAAVAFLASTAQTRDLCCALVPGFDADDGCGGFHLESTRASLQSRVLPSAALGSEGRAQSQRELSGMVDAAVLEQVLSNNRQDTSFCAAVHLNRVPSAGVWLTAPLVDDGCQIDAPLFKVSLK